MDRNADVEAIIAMLGSRVQQLKVKESDLFAKALENPQDDYVHVQALNAQEARLAVERVVYNIFQLQNGHKPNWTR